MTERRDILLNSLERETSRSITSSSCAITRILVITDTIPVKTSTPTTLQPLRKVPRADQWCERQRIETWRMKQRMTFAAPPEETVWQLRGRVGGDFAAVGAVDAGVSSVPELQTGRYISLRRGTVPDRGQRV